MNFEEAQARKAVERDEAIERLRSEAKARGQLGDRAFWSMVYDFEMAPVTTNRRQLGEVGVSVPPSASIDDALLAGKLREICDALGRLNVYLLHTDHLSDRELYERLEKEILDEEVRDIPALDGVREYIDLVGTGSAEDCDLLERYYSDDPEESAPYQRDCTLPRPPEGCPF